MARWVALVCLALLACGEEPHIGGPAPTEEPEPIPPESLTLDFGAVLVGQVSRQTLHLHNDGDHTAALWLTGPIEEPFAVADAPTEIAPGADGELILEFAPATASPAVGTATFRLGRRTIAVTILGSGAVSGDTSCLAPSLDALSFPTTCDGSDVTLSFRNVCNGPLFVRRAQIPETGSFAISHRPAMPLALAAGDSFEMSLSYRPELPFPEHATLELGVGETGVLTVPLEGSGRETQPAQESFDGPERPKRDILFVIDDSAALDPYRARLAQFASALLAMEQENGSDYRIGVTTTSVQAPEGCVTPSGRLLPLDGSRERFVTRDTPDPAAVLAANLADAVSHCDPQPPNQALEALRKALWDAPPEELVRYEDASIEVILVTATEDASPRTVYEYGQAIEGRIPSRHWNSISWTDWLYSSGPWLGIGRYLLEGSPVDLDGSGNLEDPEELEVLVDGTSLPSRDPENGNRVWEYVPDVERIDFYPLYIPGYDTRIEVRYRSFCKGGGE